MGRFWTWPLRNRRWKWLFLSLIGLISWLIDNLVADWATEKAKAVMTNLGFPEWVASLLRLSGEHPVYSVVILGVIVVVVMACLSYRELKLQRPDGKIASEAPTGDETSRETKRTEAIKRLVELVHFATDTLLPAEIGPQWSLRSLQERINLWEDDANCALAQAGCSETDKSYFGHLVTFVPRGLEGINAEHSHMREMLAEKIHRLREIARRIEAAGDRPVEHEPKPRGLTSGADVVQPPEQVSVTFDWRDGARFGNDPRPEYRQWMHVVFILRAEPSRKRIGTRAHIDLRNDTTNNTSRLRAEIAYHNGHEHHCYLSQHAEYSIPVWLALDRPVQLWVDRMKDINTQTASGVYVTDSVFLESPALRSTLLPGRYSVRAVLIVDGNEFCSEWREIVVQR